MPEEVLRQAQQAIMDIDGSGIGIMEHSHRGKVFDRVMAEAVSDCRELAGITDDYHVLFLQGGASLQFAMVPMTFLSKDKTADYLDTGSWTNKAVKEAKLFGNVNLAFDGSACKYDHVPGNDELSLTNEAAYSWYCSNNTIFGTEFHHTPATHSPLICDASSNIYSAPIDIAAHAMIFAGAQKNLGPAGCTLLIVQKAFLDQARTEGIPSILQYGKHAEKNSCLNTPPTFAIYIMGRVFRWILDEGGLEAMNTRNREKAAIVYEAIDDSPFYSGVARPDSRSLMNVTFRTPNDELDKKFIAEATEHDMSGLKGHRSAGGLRASIYNAFPRGGCQVLAQFMRDFAARNG
jgi:phosphoserine aminotransferase